MSGARAVGDRHLGPVSCRLVTETADLAAHRHIRREVFVREQTIFTESDTDYHDRHPKTLFVLGHVGQEPAGAVRLFPLDGDGLLWQGDRLAVLPPYRAAGIGAPLVRFAVATAAARGGERMIAHIQLPNERFFTRLGWSRRSEPQIYLGHPHLLMDIRLRAVAAAAGSPLVSSRPVLTSAASAPSPHPAGALGS